MAALAEAVIEDASLQLRVPPAARRRLWLTVSDQGVLLTNRWRPADQHDRRHARRHPGARRPRPSSARPTSCAACSSACRARPCRSTHAARYVDADAHALDVLPSAPARRCWPRTCATTSPRTSPRRSPRGDDDGAEARSSSRSSATCNGEPKSTAAQHHPAHIDGEPRLLPARHGHHASRRPCSTSWRARSGRCAARRRSSTSATPRCKVLLEQREQDRRELEERIVRNVDQLIEPTLDRLSQRPAPPPGAARVEALRANLREIVGPFGAAAGATRRRPPPLTRREKEVANLVRLGRPATRSPRRCT